MSGQKRVEDLMTTDIKTIGRNDKVGDGDALMEMARIRHLPVLDDDGESLVGIVSQRDLFRGALARALGYGKHAQDRLLESLRVKDVMTNDPITVGPDTPVQEAARMMLEHRIGCLPVVTAGRVVGLLSESDLVRLATE